MTVVIASPGGPGVAAFQETVSLGPNVTSQSVSIPISNDLLPGRNDIAIPLTLSSPSAGASLGGAASARLVIHDNNPPLVTITSVRVATVKVGTGKKAKRQTGLLVQLSGALNPGQAEGLVAYHLLSGKVKKKGHINFNKPIPLSSAIYNSSAHILTLVPKSKLNLAQPERLTITASMLTDFLGRPLDGNHDGQPGGDFVATLKGKSATIAATTNAKKTSFSSVVPEVVDRVLAGGTQRVAAWPQSVRAQWKLQDTMRRD